MEMAGRYTFPSLKLQLAYLFLSVGSSVQTWVNSVDSHPKVTL